MFRFFEVRKCLVIIYKKFYIQFIVKESLNFLYL
jgi:hypothetical protein